MKEAEQVFREMKECGYPRGAIAFTHMFRLFKKNLARTRYYHDLMLVDGCRPDRMSLNTLIEIYAKFEMHQEVENIVRKMEALEIRKNVVTYTLLMSLYGKFGDLKKVNDLLEVC